MEVGWLAAPTVVAEAMPMAMDSSSGAQLVTALVVVPAGEPMAYNAAMATATALATLGRAERAVGQPRPSRGQLVEMGGGGFGPMRMVCARSGAVASLVMIADRRKISCTITVCARQSYHYRRGD